MLANQSHKAGGGGKMDGLHDNGRAILETLAGAGLVSVPFWSHVMEDVIRGGQMITAITGAVIGLSGVYRIFFRTKRRKYDK